MATKIDTERTVLTVDDALALLGGAVGRSTLYKNLRAGVIPHRRIGKKILIPRTRFMEWLYAEQPAPEPQEAR
jgi:excisionase family DNA binding protein